MQKRWKERKNKNLAGLLVVALVLILVLSFTGCQKKSGSEMDKLFAEGYSITSASADETMLGILLQKEGSFESVYMAKAEMNPQKYEAYCKAMESEDFDAALLKFVRDLDGLTVSDITGEIPSQEKLNEYVGKTIGDLEDMGYESTGWIGEAGDYVLTYDGPAYCLKVIPEADAMTGDMDDYSANDIRAMTIGSVEFAGFSSSIFDALSDQ